jgi:hypothetical protein
MGEEVDVNAENELPLRHAPVLLVWTVARAIGDFYKYTTKVRGCHDPQSRLKPPSNGTARLNAQPGLFVLQGLLLRNDQERRETRRRDGQR